MKFGMWQIIYAAIVVSMIVHFTMRLVTPTPPKPPAQQIQLK